MNRVKDIVKDTFIRMGEFLVRVLKLDRSGKGKLELQQEIVSLSAGRKSSIREYYVKKMAYLLAVLIGGMAVSLMCFCVYLLRGEETRMQSVARPGYGEGDRKELLTVHVEGEEDDRELEINVQERRYTDEEKQRLLDRALLELEQKLPGENDSLDEVRKDLVFPQSLADGAVKVSFLTIPYGVIAEDGSLTGSEDENGTQVEIQGTLTCAGMETIHTIFVKVFPPKLPEQERFMQSVRKEVEQADLRDSHEEKVELPQKVEDKELQWIRRTQNPFPSALMITLILALGIWIEMDSMTHRRAEERKGQLLLDYPDLMWKMTMLLGAGLSMKGIFTRISDEYLREKKNSKKMHHVYEEVTYTCREMQSGIPESQAYERFGKRCQLPEYIRLGSVLSQNLKKGSKGLIQLLEAEAESSLTDRKNHARKIGERAGTKLLFPMMLMLGIVLVILMVPVFLSF